MEEWQANSDRGAAERRHIIDRPRLTRLLDQTRAPVIMLVAAAGYGKTTLARQWIEDKPHAWYNITSASSDVAALVLGLARALADPANQQLTLLRERLRATREPEREVPRLIELFAGSFENELQNGWIVLDDYQALAGSAAAEDFVEGIVRRTPARILLTSRSRPRWADARQILYGELYEIGQIPLAMCEEEAETLLQHVGTKPARGLAALAHGWPAVLGLPTSAGKTAALDVALFHIVLDANKPPHERRAPRRIFFIVDRRLVVDEAYERACLIQDRLRQALRNGQGILAEAARQLINLALQGEAEAVEVIRLRGGLPRERAFLRNPLKPAIILSTVDQVGSRLLFRGYGVSEFMRPIHAALVGFDSLTIVDEAHLSRPFGETLQWVQRYQSEAWAEQIIGKSTTVVQMTATPHLKDGGIFTLQDEDWKHEVLGARLKCNKPAEIVSVNDTKEDPQATHTALVELLAIKATALMAAMGETSMAPVVGIVVNRVGTARRVFDRLRSDKQADAVLLTGRVRPFEREELLKTYLPRMKAVRASDANPRPLYVVATQTVEVGADLDFDGLVTEAAALDALRQRFGRLNRLGKRKDSRAVIVYVKFGRTSEADPVYGEALAETCKWMENIAAKRKGKKGLQEQKVLDFGIRAMRTVLPARDKLEKLLAPTRQAPVLMPAHVDMLVQTSPSPMVEPEVSAYLHGIESQAEDVQIIWRADLPETLAPDDEDTIIATVAMLPPIQLEAVAVPVWAARALLKGSLGDDVPDVEGAAATKDADETEFRR